MFKVNDYLVYKREVCVVKELIDNEKGTFYVLSPVNDNSLTIKIPTNSDKLVRPIISKEEVKRIINDIPKAEIIEIPNEKLIEQEYKRLLSDATHDSLVKIIKTTYLRNENRKNNNKKISDRDDTYFKKAEQLLYTELSIALNMSYDEAKEYVINKVEENENN